MTSAVDALVAETSKRKGLTLKADTSTGKVSASLTPVGTEKRIPDEVMFLGNEAILGIIRTLRKTADELEAGLGVTPEERSKADRALDIKLMEREADRQAADRAKADAGDVRAQERVMSTSTAQFQEDYARLSAEAQAATFSGDFVPAAKEIFGDDLVSGSPVAGWECPTHGDRSLKDNVSKRTKRQYRSCTECMQFEKGE